MLSRTFLPIIFIALAFCIKAQNGIEDCFNGTLSFNDQQCSFVNEPIQPDCGPLRYYLPTIWRNPGLDVPTTLFMYTAFDTANVRVFSSDGLSGSPSFEDNLLVTQSTPVDYPLVGLSSLNFRVESSNYNQVEQGKGLIIESDVPVTILYRLVNIANQSFFVLKGIDGLGYGFSAASQTDVTVPATPSEAHFVSVMAREDNTQVRFQKDGYFIEGPNNNSSSTGDIDLSGGLIVALDAGETYIVRDNVSSASSVSGMLVTSDKPVTVISGSSHSRHGSGVNDRDAGMDQLIPINKAGNEYVAVRGTNIADIDYLILIGIIDGTQISVNGSIIGTINAGEVMEHKLAGTGGELFYISGSNIFCAYHVSGLFDEEVGMAQLPSLEECSGNAQVDFALIGLDQHILNVIIPNAGLPSLTLNGTSYTAITTASAVPGINYSVVSFTEADFAAMGNVLASDELFHVGVTTGNAVGGSYGFLTKYGNELVLFDPATSVPLSVSSFETFVAATVASSTGFTQDIGVITCSPPAFVVSVNGNTSSFTTVNGGTVNFSGQSVDYLAATGFVGFEDLEVVIEDASGELGAVCLRIGVFLPEICGNGIDDDLDGEIDEEEECPIDPCEDDCDNPGCSPEIIDVFPLDPICDDLNGGGIGILSSTPDVEYSIDDGLTFQTDPSFFNLPSGQYFILVRRTDNDCETEWPGNPVILAEPNCENCIADAGDPRDAQFFCEIGSSISISVAPNTNSVVPPGFEIVYILTKEPKLQVLDYKIGTSTFTVNATGNYRIHTLIAEVNNSNSDDFFDLNIITRNESTLLVVIQCIQNHNVCAALDNRGSFIKVLDSNDQSCITKENTIRKCTDNTDNDGDGLVDCRDPECQGFMICKEDNSQNCNDAIDNDGDGLIDCEDPECLEFLYCDEDDEQCSDGIDNDNDGLIDCQEPNCQDEAFCNENNVITCCDGIDNDNDGRTDCDDSECEMFLYCREHTFADCTDGIDNDLDGLIDCADPNCQLLNIFACSLEDTEINCSDGIDNDDDGLVDCFDDQCAQFDICDSDGDGLAGVLDIDDNDPCVPINSSNCEQVVTGETAGSTSQFLNINVKVFLEGPYDEETGLMTKRLNEQGYLPGQKPWTFFGSSTQKGQPYARAPWNYSGGEGAGFDANIKGLGRFAGYPEDAVDWVLLSLRTTTGPETEVYRTAALLLSDGTVEIVEGFEYKNTEQRSYYVVVEHRNHMAVMSGVLALAINGQLHFDFSLADSYNVGLGQGQMACEGITYAMIAGNAELMQSTSSYVDINAKDLGKMGGMEGMNSGYYLEDLDLDGDVNTGDKSICLKNNGLFTTLKFE